MQHRIQQQSKTEPLPQKSAKPTKESINLMSFRDLQNHIKYLKKYNVAISIHRDKAVCKKTLLNYYYPKQL
jgi:hypothetical protein